MSRWRSTRLEQLDFKTAFLNALVKEHIYVRAPDGMDIQDGYVLKLNKALYGIKQAPREWHEEIDRYLRLIGYSPCRKDSCRAMVGSLIYASISTRPDITHAVNMISRHMNAPTNANMIMAKRILRYLNGTRHHGLLRSQIDDRILYDDQW
jgi:hypothetical protein